MYYGVADEGEIRCFSQDVSSLISIRLQSINAIEAQPQKFHSAFERHRNLMGNVLAASFLINNRDYVVKRGLGYRPVDDKIADRHV